jgi:sterol desaturase/sphingolipid hydroxylase (fatty acid hydroxylase superfamily)
MLPDAQIETALRNLLQGVGLIGGMFAVVGVLEALSSANLRRYYSRSFATDLLYAVMYIGGLYSLLISAPVLAVIALALPESWRLHVLDALPPVAAFFAYWLIADAIQYWLHRWMHSSRLLWRVHSVHHSQTCLTFATSWRNHVLEQLFLNVAMFVPLMLLGMPKWYWLPVLLAQYVFEALQHSELNWRYGRLYPIFVSPVFHAIHHDPQRARHDSNYGKILGIWDWIFGTLSRGDRPLSYGVAGMRSPVGFWDTMWAPFRNNKLPTPGFSGSMRTEQSSYMAKGGP